MKKFGLATALVAIIACASFAEAMPGDQPGDAAFCNNYAFTTKQYVDGVLARKPSCLDYSKGVHNNYQMHFDWCRRTARGDVEGAAQNIRRLGNICLSAGQGGGNFGGRNTGGNSGQFGAGNFRDRGAGRGASANGCPAPGRVRSLNSDRSTHIVFVNSTGGPLKFYWLDFQGQRVFYQELQPGRNYRQQTFMTHPWVAVNARGNCVNGVMEASRVGDNRIEIFGN
ncbi:MAG: hypothetical protein M9883_20675 [Methylobacteriaceae bacterium]|nr:hypothetical protein [Methylobacteriaceae bacterium]